MEAMTNTKRDRIVERYVRLLDAGRLDLIEPILKAAEDDLELAELIADVTEGYAEDAGLSLRDEDKARADAVLQRAFEASRHVEADDNRSDSSPSGQTIRTPSSGDASAHPYSFMKLIVSNTHMRPSQVEPVLNATAEFIDDVNDYPDVAGRAVVLRLVHLASQLPQIFESQALYAFEHNPPRRRMAASRDESYDHARPTFEEILERSQMTEKQKAFWRSVAEEGGA